MKRKKNPTGRSSPKRPYAQPAGLSSPAIATSTMPTSKTRKKPTTTSRPDRPAGPATLETATLAVTEAALQLVKESEARIIHAAREGGDTEKALAVHHSLRSGTLGFLEAWCRLTGQPSPITGEPFAD